MKKVLSDIPENGASAQARKRDPRPNRAPAPANGVHGTSPSSEMSRVASTIQTFSEATEKVLSDIPENDESAQARKRGLTLEDLAKAKGLPVEALEHLGIRTCKHRQVMRSASPTSTRRARK